LEDLGRAGGGDARGAEVVLERHRDAGQRSRVLAGGDPGVDGVGRGQCLLAGDVVEGVELGVAGLDRGEVLLDDRAGAALPGADGTRNIPSSVEGASARTASRTPASRATSGRMMLASGNGWAVGGTSSSSSASTSAAWSRTAASCEVKVSSCSSVSRSRAS